MTQGKQISVAFARNFSEFGQVLDQSNVNFVYVHQNFVFKLPVLCYNKAESTAGLLMTSLLFSAANGVAYMLL